ncbi:MAG: hypothetical protein NTX50_09440 [Candidatus Sumerlaeota bacterium]|nr:hypothetical protein [Candidatus Sumerlaeota bacterium]
MGASLGYALAAQDSGGGGKKSKGADAALSPGRNVPSLDQSAPPPVRNVPPLDKTAPPLMKSAPPLDKSDSPSDKGASPLSPVTPLSPMTTTLSTMPPLPATSAPAYPADVVFCIDVTTASRDFDPKGARGAAILFADALLPEGSRRAALVFSNESRSLMAPSVATLAVRAFPADLNYSLPYVLDTPARGVVNPIKAMEHALDLLKDSRAARKAVFILLGHRLQISQAGELNRRIAQVAAEIAPRCRLQNTQLFIAHRDRLDEIGALWNDIAGATGGAAAFIEDPEDLVPTVLDWSAAFSGILQMAPGEDKSAVSVQSGQKYAAVFDMAQDSPELAQKRLLEKRFSLEDENKMIVMGGYGLALLTAEASGTLPTPIPSDRMRRFYSRLAQRIHVTASPELLFADSTWTIRVDMGPGSARLDSQKLLPEGSCAQLRQILPAGSKEKPKPRIETLRVIKDALGKSLIYEARFAPPLEAGRYGLYLGAKPGKQPAEFLKLDARVFPKAMSALIGLEPGEGTRKKLTVKAAPPDSFQGQVSVWAAVQQDGAALRYVNAIAAGDRYEILLSNEYLVGGAYRVVLGALGLKGNNFPAYLPGPLKQFPPPIPTPETLPAEIVKRTATTPLNADSLAIPPLDVKPKKVEIAQATALPTKAAQAEPLPKGEQTPSPKAESASPTLVASLPLQTAAPARVIASAKSNDMAYFVAGNVTMLVFLIALLFVGFRLGLFPGRLAELQFPQNLETPAREEESTLKTDGPSPAAPSPDKAAQSAEDALKEALKQEPPRRQLTEMDLLGSAATIREEKPASAEPPSADATQPVKDAAGAAISAAGVNLSAEAPATEKKPTAPVGEEEVEAPEAEKETAATGRIAKEGVSKPAPFTEGDLLEALVNESIADAGAEGRQPDSAQSQPITPAAQDKAAPQPAEAAAVGVAPPPAGETEKKDSDMAAGFLSQEDLDALLSGAGPQHPKN